MIPRSPSVGEGVLEPNEVDADALLERMAEITAQMILVGPSLDDTEWHSLFWNQEGSHK